MSENQFFDNFIFPGLEHYENIFFFEDH